MRSYFSKWVGIVAILCMGIFVTSMPSTSHAMYTIQSQHQSVSGAVEGGDILTPIMELMYHISIKVSPKRVLLRPQI
jgi:hypothetical protein